MLTPTRWPSGPLFRRNCTKPSCRKCGYTSTLYVFIFNHNTPHHKTNAKPRKQQKVGICIINVSQNNQHNNNSNNDTTEVRYAAYKLWLETKWCCVMNLALKKARVYPELIYSNLLLPNLPDIYIRSHLEAFNTHLTWPHLQQRQRTCRLVVGRAIFGSTRRTLR